MSHEACEVSGAERSTTQMRTVAGSPQSASNRDVSNALPKPDKDFVAAFLEKHKIESRKRLKRALLRSDELQSFDNDHFESETPERQAVSP